MAPDAPEGSSEPPPSTMPIVQVACIVGIVVVFWLDTRVPEVTPPKEIYFLLTGIATGLIPANWLRKRLQ